MKWATAVKLWNEQKKSVNPDHCYCIPKKGTPEHAEVGKIHAAEKAKAAPAAPKVEDKAKLTGLRGTVSQIKAAKELQRKVAMRKIGETILLHAVRRDFEKRGGNLGLAQRQIAAAAKKAAEKAAEQKPKKEKKAAKED